MEALVLCQEWALARRNCQMQPTILVAMRIVRQRRQRAVFVGREDQASFEKSLKTIANSQDQLLFIAEAAQRFAQENGELVGEDLPGANVIAVAKATWDDEDLILVEQAGIFPKAVDVDALG